MKSDKWGRMKSIIVDKNEYIDEVKRLNENSDYSINLEGQKQEYENGYSSDNQNNYQKQDDSQHNDKEKQLDYPSIINLYNSKQMLKYSMLHQIDNITQNIQKTQSKLQGKNKVFIKNNKQKSLLHKLIIDPENYYKSVYEIVMFGIIIYVSTLYIYQKVFHINDETYKIRLLWQSYILDIIFGFDMILQFFCAYQNNFNIVVRQYSKIFQNYIQGSFVFDFFSCFPFYLFIEFNNQQFLCFIKISKLYRILNNFKKYSSQFKKIKIVKMIYNKLDSGMQRFFAMMFYVILSIHISACIFFTIAQLQEFQPDTWVYQKELVNEASHTQYVYSLYWSIQTITTVGFGDFILLNDYEKLYAILWITIGAAFYSFLISNLQSIAQSKVTYNTDQYSLTSLSQFALDTNLPQELLQKMKNYFNISFSEFGYQQKLNNGLDLEKLPFTIKAQLMIYLNYKIISRLNLFIYQPVQCIMKVIPHLRPVCFDNGEIIYTEGEQSDEIYFIYKGSVSFKNNQGLEIISYQENSHFGAIELFELNNLRQHTAVASSDCMLIYLNKNEVLSICNEYSSINQILKNDIKNQQNDIDIKKKKLQKYHQDKKSIIKLGLGLKIDPKLPEHEKEKMNNRYKFEYSAISKKFQIKKDTLNKRIKKQHIQNGFGLLMKKYIKKQISFEQKDQDIYDHFVQNNKLDSEYEKIIMRLVNEYKNTSKLDTYLKDKIYQRIMRNRYKIHIYTKQLRRNINQINNYQKIINFKLDTLTAK